MTEIRDHISAIVKTGEYVAGTESTLKALWSREPRLIVLSSNCRREDRDRILYYARLALVPHLTVSETTLDLGSMCGKPHPIAALAVLDVGDSTVLEELRGGGSG